MTNIKITDKAGVTLKTAGKYCSEDIGVTIDESLLGGGENMLQTLIDDNNSCGYLFSSKSLDAIALVETLDTSNVTSFIYMFQNSSSLITAPKLNASKVTHMTSMFEGCSNLTTVPAYDTPSLRFTNNMFKYCSNLTTVEELNMISCDSSQNMFYGCTSLTNLKLKNIKYNLQVGSGTSYGHLLTLDSLVGLCKECIKQSSSRKLTIGSGNIEKLANVYVKFTDSTQTEIAVGEKGEVEVCESTDTGAMLIKDYMTLKSWDLA